MTISPPPADARLVAELWREARPKQWLKNVLVFAAPGAAGVILHGNWWRIVLALLAFCAAASGTYFLNDVADVDEDRLHPTKRNRPVAAGTIPVPLARLVGVVLLLTGLGFAAATVRWQLVAVVATYIVLTISYSVWLKHVAVVDLVAVACGFLLRAIGGAVVVDVPTSNWFLLCTGFGSLLVVAGKRYGEQHELGDGGATRSSLSAYTPSFLRTVIGLACAVSVISYCLWAFEKAAVAESSATLYELSVIPMVTALLRYVLVLEQGRGAAPEDVFLEDRVLQLLGLIWLALFAAGVSRG